MKEIIRFFAKEHIFGNLVTLLIIIVGIYSVFTIRRDIWPEVPFNVTTINTFLGGAAPEQIEKLIINPIEESVREVDGLRKVRSTATESKGVVVVQIDPDSRSADKTNQDIQQAVDRTEDLPSDAEKPIVTVIDSNKTPVIEITVYGSASPMNIRNTAKFVADEISLIKGVSSVTKNGFRKREYRVNAEANKLAARRVSLSQLINSISQRNVSVPGGSVKNTEGAETLVRTEAEFSSEKELAQALIVANDAGFGTRVNSVATVEETLAKPERLYRANGESSINLIVLKKKNSDALQLVKDVRERVDQLKKKLKPGVELGFSNDFSIYLSNRLNTLGSNLAIGLILVVLVLSLFLPWRVTLVVAVGIPVALLASLSIIDVSGISLNLISLIGLIIVLGMLVDDAIVVSENIWRHMEIEGPSERAIVQGAKEVLAPVFASIMTTVSAFAPMLFMTGIFGSFVFQIPVMVILALAISLFEAFIIMPSHFGSWVAPFVSAIDMAKQRAAEKKHWFNKVQTRYVGYVKWSLNRRYLMLSTLVGVFAAAIALVVITGRFVLFPGGGATLFFITLEAPIGTSLEKTESLAKKIESQTSLIPSTEILDVVTSVGMVQQGPMDPQTKRGSHFAHIRINLTPSKDRDRSAAEIMEWFKSQVKTPDGVTGLTFEMAKEGPPQGRPISINILGQNFKELRKIAHEFREVLSSQKGVIAIQDSFQQGKNEWQVIPKDQATASVGLTAMDISQSVRASFEGIVASSVRELDEEVDIRVMLDQKPDSVLGQLKNLQIGNRSGNLIYLNRIAEFKEVKTLSAISHVDYKRTINVSANVQEEVTTAGAVVKNVTSQLKEIIKKYPEYSFEFGGEDEDTKESMGTLFRSFIFAAFFIFSLLIITFRNILQPILILTSIPLGITGVIIAFFVHNRPLSFMAMLGIIALAGVIVNNAIVFIDFVNTARKRGLELSQSIISAAEIRLRPIILTTATTLCGLLPTAYGDYFQKWFGVGGSDPFIVPIALALSWGLGFGSVMTAIFFPAMVRILDDVQIFVKKIFKRGNELNLSIDFDEQLKEIPIKPNDMIQFVRQSKKELDAEVEPKKRTQLSSKIGYYLKVLGEYNEAYKYLRQAVDLVSSHQLGQRHEVIHSLRFAQVLQNQQKFSQSDAIFEKMIHICSQVENCSDLLDFAYQHLGKSLFDQGRYEEAMKAFEKAKDLRTQKGDEDLMGSTLLALQKCEDRLKNM